MRASATFASRDKPRLTRTDDLGATLSGSDADWYAINGQGVPRQEPDLEEENLALQAGTFALVQHTSSTHFDCDTSNRECGSVV